MDISNVTNEQLYRIAAHGDSFAYNALMTRLVSLSVSITVNTVNTKGIKGFDFGEARGIANQAVLTTFARYESGRPIINYFSKVFLRELYKYIDEINEERKEMRYISLDDNAYEEGAYTYYDAIGTLEGDPNTEYTLNELSFMLSDSKKEDQPANKLQKKALRLKRDGYEIKEIAKKLKISSSRVRRLLENNKSGTFLHEMQIRLGDK